MACSHSDSALVHVAVTIHVINLQFVFESYSPIAGSVSWVFGVQSGSLHGWRAVLAVVDSVCAALFKAFLESVILVSPISFPFLLIFLVFV